jgi:hypothetical protein
VSSRVAVGSKVRLDATKETTGHRSIRVDIASAR